MTVAMPSARRAARVPCVTAAVLHRSVSQHVVFVTLNEPYRPEPSLHDWTHSRETYSYDVRLVLIVFFCEAREHRAIFT